MLNNRVCRECGRIFPGGPRAWYCPSCRKERRDASVRRCKKRSRQGITRKLGSLSPCAVCGKDYVVRSAMQKYCPDCAPEAIRLVDAAQGLAYYHANKATLNPSKNAKRRKIRKTARCIICGKDFPKHGPAQSCPDCRADFRRLSQALSDYHRRGLKPPR
jgi:Zn finger protein HypA/HybF involved in hydrogenase expression